MKAAGPSAAGEEEDEDAVDSGWGSFEDPEPSPTAEVKSGVSVSKEEPRSGARDTAKSDRPPLKATLEISRSERPPLKATLEIELELEIEPPPPPAQVSAPARPKLSLSERIDAMLGETSEPAELAPKSRSFTPKVSDAIKQAKALDEAIVGEEGSPSKDRPRRTVSTELRPSAKEKPRPAPPPPLKKPPPAAPSGRLLGLKKPPEPPRSVSRSQTPKASVPPAEAPQIDVETPSKMSDEELLALELEESVPSSPGQLEARRSSRPPDLLRGGIAAELGIGNISITESVPPSTANSGEENDPISQVRDRFDRGDFTGALAAAEALLADTPDNPAAQRYRKKCEEKVAEIYVAELGSRSCVPKLLISHNKLQALSLDHRSGFLISLIDGLATVDDLLDISGMPAFEALRILNELKQDGVIET